MTCADTPRIHTANALEVRFELGDTRASLHPAGTFSHVVAQALRVRLR
jgi:hypothetical protein